MPDTLCLAGALVAPHSHDDLVVGVHESGAEVVPAVSVLDFGLGFDVTEGPAGEANVALDLTESVWTFGQGGFRFRDASGPLLYTGASGDDLFLTGDLDVSGHGALGALAAVQAYEVLRLSEAFATTGFTQARGLYVNVSNSGAGVGVFLGGSFFAEHTGASSRSTTGLFGQAKSSAAADGSIVEGLNFAATANAGGYVVAQVVGIKVTAQSVVQTAAVTDAYGLWVVGSWTGSKPTTARGVYVASSFAPSGVGTAYGVHVEDLAGSVAVRLLELGPATPYLRLVGGGNPGVEQTNLYLAEGATPTLRRVQWKAGNTLGAGDKVMVLV